ncbi:bifunctional enoyl-CoA hydratase/phosphate acetyltransferase [Polynucleobacter brandtiae]|uniref:Phosphate acetyltransferase/phosphate butyryltransferase n=1 Tax=Polynucleobacter brandtiae TaxID=1938816 RepID=A0A2M8VZ34_9BURK|nr:bifunctional enoyl-CoA hydratase/phosphate acetyltransferase [Polynucleobacter brandtiae]PJI83117.1 phosphate acetyltransferase/phosphate butyryltransferase [Polynucleobacter brandtiae]
MEYPLLEKIIEEAKGDLPLGVVYPLSIPALETVAELIKKSLCSPVLIGPIGPILELAASAKISLDGALTVDTPDDPILATKKAVEMVKDGKVLALMKGSLHTEELMGPIVSRDGLRTDKRISHLFLFELTHYHKLIGISDAVVNIAPNAALKREILFNSLSALKKLGISNAKVALIAATEVINLAMQSTTDAKEIVDEHLTNPIFPGAIIEGPFGFDNAISAESAKIKGISSQVAGDPDLLLVPDLQVGNILYKSFVYMAGAECAGAILGAQVPIVLTSRSDSVFSRVASTAMAILLAKNLNSK